MGSKHKDAIKPIVKKAQVKTKQAQKGKTNRHCTSHVGQELHQPVKHNIKVQQTETDHYITKISRLNQRPFYAIINPRS